MIASCLLSIAFLVAVTNARPNAPLLKRKGCHYTPNATNSNGDSLASPAFLLRVEEHSTNETFGYVDAFSTPYAIINSYDSASPGFYAPDYNAYGSLIFYAGPDGVDRGFTASTQSLANSSSVAPVSTAGCGTAPIRLETKYDDQGTCGEAGYTLDVHFRCPIPGTANDTPSPCWAQVYFACMATGLPDIPDDQAVIFYGNATTAAKPPNCCVIDLVSECP